MTKIPIIHRDGTFEYKGVKYRVVTGGPYPTRGDGRWIDRINSDEPGDWTMVADDLSHMSDVREFLTQAVENDWDDLDQIAVTERHFRAEH